MWTPWETSKECPEFKRAPPFILEGDVTVCIYVRTLRTIASILGVADWTSPTRLRPWSRVHLVISMLTPSRLQRSKLPVQYSFRSRLRLHHQGGSTPFVYKACKAVHQGGGVGCAVAQHSPQAVKSDHTLLNNNKTTKHTVQCLRVRIEVTMACTLRVANQIKKILCPE